MKVPIYNPILYSPPTDAAVLKTHFILWGLGGFRREKKNFLGKRSGSMSMYVCLERPPHQGFCGTSFDAFMVLGTSILQNPKAFNLLPSPSPDRTSKSALGEAPLGECSPKIDPTTEMILFQITMHLIFQGSGEKTQEGERWNMQLHVEEGSL